MDDELDYLDDLLIDETEGYSPKNKKLNPFIEELDLEWDDELEYEEIWDIE